jgi:hypothetical protein
MKTGLDSLTNFLSSQVKIKIFVDSSINTQEIAQILNQRVLLEKLLLKQRRKP